MMIVEVHEVPDEALDALLEAAPGRPASASQAGAREDWRQALAAALTAWESRPRALAAVPVHECVWKMRGVKHQKVLGLSQTFVLQRCEGCGEMKTQQLTGEWDMADLDR